MGKVPIEKRASQITGPTKLGRFVPFFGLTPGILVARQLPGSCALDSRSCALKTDQTWIQVWVSAKEPTRRWFWPS